MVYTVYCMESMEAQEHHPYARGVAKSGILFALVAALSFGAGLTIGASGSASAVVSRVPFIGDGLDPSPDTAVELDDFWKAWNVLESEFVVAHASSTLPTDKDRILGAIEGLAASYQDPYTVFLPPVEAKQFEENISGTFAGVGMEIGKKEDVLTVIAPLKGTPAEAAGIRPGDQIALIDGAVTEGMSVEEAVSKIRGPAGTSVILTLVRGGKPLEIKVVRAKIEVPETEDELLPSGVYRIALYQFTANSPDLFNRAFERFKASGARRLIVDMRGNPGGYLEAAVDMASHFLPRGATVVTEDYDGKDDNRVHKSRGYNDLPEGTKVAVLIDGGSASASEIFAGALKDAGVATIIGATSFGKGSVQTLVNVAGGALKITIARWVTPGGHSIEGNGVAPHVSVPYTPADAEAGRDPQLARAVEFLTTGQ